MRAEIEELKAQARTITKNEIHAIVGKRPDAIEVLEACGKVCIDIHLGENMPEEPERYTYRLLKTVAERLGTDLLDLRKETYSEGCDTCSHNRDLGWAIWCRPTKGQND